MPRKDPEAQRKYKSEYYKKNRDRLRKRDNERYRLRKDAYYSVYYLPEEHYIGSTCYIRKRLNEHARRGKIIDGWVVIAWFEREVDAYWFEILFHQRGYNGFRTKTHNQKTNRQLPLL